MRRKFDAYDMHLGLYAKWISVAKYTKDFKFGNKLKTTTTYTQTSCCYENFQVDIWSHRLEYLCEKKKKNPLWKSSIELKFLGVTIVSFTRENKLGLSNIICKLQFH